MKKITLVTILVALAVLAACAPAATPVPPTAAPAPTNAPAPTTAASGEPIKVGMIAGLSGGFIQSETVPTVKAYFELINAQGGINGRKLELYAEDDKTDPAAASQAARRLVDDIGVVANVGTASALDCAVNGAYYLEKGMVSIPGTGVDGLCFASPNVSAVNTGPFLSTVLALDYATQNLGKKKICAFMTQLPGVEPVYRAMLGDWQKRTGITLAVEDYAYKPGDEPTPFILKAKDAGCEVVYYTGSDAFMIAWLQAIKQQGLMDKFTWIFGGAGYTSNLAKAVGKDSDGIYTLAEFAPWSIDTPDLKEWAGIVDKLGIQRTSFSLGSYIAAKIFVDTLKATNGNITRETVTQAFKSLKPYNTPLLGTPYTFGDAPAHQSNQAIKMLILKDGQWAVADPNWISVKQ